MFQNRALLTTMKPERFLLLYSRFLLGVETFQKKNKASLEILRT